MSRKFKNFCIDTWMGNYCETRNSYFIGFYGVKIDEIPRDVGTKGERKEKSHLVLTGNFPRNSNGLRLRLSESWGRLPSRSNRLVVGTGNFLVDRRNSLGL